MNKIIFLVGGLAGSGKTNHLLPLIEKLATNRGLSINYLDKDLIGSTMPGKSSPDIYKAMMAIAEKSENDIIIMEGNIIGNLGLFKDYIRSQHELGAQVVCLDFQCTDAKIQHARLVQRAAVDPAAEQRDRKKLDFDYYVTTDRPGEIAKRDTQVAANQDLIEEGILKFKIIDTTTAPIQDNVDTIVKVMDDLSPKPQKTVKCQMG